MPETSTFELFHAYSEKLVAEFGLSSKSDSKLPKIITSDRRTPRDILALFAQTDDKDILERLACNPSTPDNVLMRLTNHSSTDVRVAAANNNKAADFVSEELADDDSINVRYAVASNPHSSRKALNQLKEDGNPYVARRARKTLTRLKAIKKDAVVNSGSSASSINQSMNTVALNC